MAIRATIARSVRTLLLCLLVTPFFSAGLALAAKGSHAGKARVARTKASAAWKRSPFWSRARLSTTLSAAFEDTHFAQRFSTSLRSLLTKRVPVVPRDAALPWLDAQFFAEFGMPLGRFGLIDAAHERQILKSIAVRPAKPGEVPTHHAEATRYSDEGVKTVISNEGESGGVRQGRWVLGDGRAGVMGAPLVRQKSTKARRAGLELLTLRVKGFPTGLKPLQEWDDVHTTGTQGDLWGVVDVVLGQFLHANGINVNRTPALATTNKSFPIEIYGMRFMQNEAFELNAGHFDRLAHLNEVRHSPSATAEFLTEINALVSAELGRKKPLSLAGLFRHLARRKAREVADLYWARAAHGSPTFDNIGLLQSIDPGTVSPVDRAHPHYALLRGVSDGFAKEPKQFLAPYDEFLFRRFYAVANRRERASLRRIKPKAFLKGALEQRMAANALEHLGVDLDAAQWLMKKARPEVKRFIRVVREVGEQDAPGAVAQMGETVKTEVKDPARYDIFAALSQLTTIWASGASRAAKLSHLVEALRPIEGKTARDRRAASRLMDAAAPLLDRLTANAGKDVRAAIVRLMADQAAHLNRPNDRMVRSSLDDWTKTVYDKVHAGKISNTRFRGEVNALTRDTTRRGPQSVSQIVKRIRDGELERDGAGRLIISRIDEHGVRIEEVSDGRRDLVRFSIAAAALKKGRIESPRLKYSLDGTTWLQAQSTKTSGDGTVVFEVALSGAPARIQGRFVDGRSSQRVWDLDGLAFGVGHRPLLASAAVQAALAAWRWTADKGPSPSVGVRAALLRANPSGK